MNKFKYELRSFFDKFHIKQKHFAKIVGVSAVTVSNWLSGKTQPTSVRKTHIDKIIKQYWKVMYPDYYSWCCNAIAEGVNTCFDNSAMKEGTCTSCWQFGLVSENIKKQSKKEKRNAS